MNATEIGQERQASKQVARIEQKTLQESIVVHGIAWWGMQVLSILLPYHLLFTHWDMNSPELWGVRLLRAVLAVVIVLGWASLGEGGKVTSTGQADNLFLNMAKRGEFDGSELQPSLPRSTSVAL